MKIKDPELTAQLAIITVVGLAAGAASFSHVHDWTMANSPAGTADWFGWANACISELVPIGSLLTIRRNRRAGKSIGFPVFMLLAAACLSLSAQLAVAKPSASGWLLSAVPALAFMGLMKMVLAGLPTKAADPVPMPTAPVVQMPAPVPVVQMPAEQPVADAVPVRADAESAQRQPRKTRKPVVPAHPERAGSASRTDAEMVMRAEQLKPQLGTWQKVADELGISIRKLQNIRKAAAEVTA